MAKGTLNPGHTNPRFGALLKYGLELPTFEPIKAVCIVHLYVSLVLSSEDE